MSRAYRISVTRAWRERVIVADGVCLPLELLPILPQGDTRRILRDELLRRGFRQADDKRHLQRDDEGGLHIEVDLDKAEVHLELEREAQLSLKTTLSAAPDNAQRDLGRSELEQQADEQLEERAEQGREGRRRLISDELESRLDGLQSELDEIVNRVTAEALKKRAAQLGEVESIHEEPETGALTIKVRL